MSSDHHKQRTRADQSEASGPGGSAISPALLSLARLLARQAAREAFAAREQENTDDEAEG